MAIITEAEAKAYLNIGDTTYDAFITVLLLAVDADIIRLCNQEIQQTTQTWEFCGNGTLMQIFDKYPVISVTSLKERDEPLDDFGDAIAATNYKILTINKVQFLYYEPAYGLGLNNYELIYISGYASGSEPEDIKLVAKEILAVYFKDADVREGIKGGRLGLNSVVESYEGMTINTSYKNLWSDWLL